MSPRKTEEKGQHDTIQWNTAKIVMSPIERIDYPPPRPSGMDETSLLAEDLVSWEGAKEFAHHDVLGFTIC